MSTSLSESPHTISLFSRYRETVTRETGLVVLDAAIQDPEYRAEAFGRVAALLASALEELRVAEQELIERNDALLVQHHEAQRRLEYERRLFESAPCALLATNLVGSITDTNASALDLLGYSKGALDHKPIASLVPLEDRPAFRSAFNRLSVAEGVESWRFRLSRMRDVPVQVTAAVRVVGRGQGVATLLWSLHPLNEPAEVRH